MKNDNLWGATICFESHLLQSQKTLRRYFWCHFGFREGVEGVGNGRGNDSGKDKVSWKYGGMGGLILDGRWALEATYPKPAAKQHGWIWGCDLNIFGGGAG